LIQSVLIFTLGFLAAALLALMVAPAIWRRAVYLTRKRIEAALPLTTNELNAEKDKLRAEHALAVRRVEMQVHALREAGARQKIVIEEQGDKLRDLVQKLAAAEANVTRLQGEVEALTGRGHELTTELSETSILLESTRTELEMRTDELKVAHREIADRDRQLQERAAEAEDADRRLSAFKAEVAHREGHIETLNAQIGELKQARKELRHQILEMGAEGRATGGTLATERKRFAQVEAKLEQSIARVSVMEDKYDRRGKELQRVHELGGLREKELRDMEQRARAAEAAAKAQEKELAELTLRIDRLMASALGEKGQEGSMDELQVKMAQQSVALRSLEIERDALQRELASAKSGEAGSGDAELREKLNQLAAEVVAMAARLEGPQSRINTLLADEKMPAAGEVVSLAERIKALQRAASVQQRGSA
jgi:chromosome segregation ATPase